MGWLLEGNYASLSHLLPWILLCRQRNMRSLGWDFQIQAVSCDERLVTLDPACMDLCLHMHVSLPHPALWMHMAAHFVSAGHRGADMMVATKGQNPLAGTYWEVFDYWSQDNGWPILDANQVRVKRCIPVYMHVCTCMCVLGGGFSVWHHTRVLPSTHACNLYPVRARARAHTHTHQRTHAPQDWTLVASAQDHGTTRITVQRLLDTCDRSQDLQIFNNTDQVRHASCHECGAAPSAHLWRPHTRNRATGGRARLHCAAGHRRDEPPLGLSSGAVEQGASMQAGGGHSTAQKPVLLEGEVGPKGSRSQHLTRELALEHMVGSSYCSAAGGQPHSR